MNDMTQEQQIEYSSVDIAIVGMAGRFPDASNVFDGLWW